MLRNAAAALAGAAWAYPNRQHSNLRCGADPGADPGANPGANPGADSSADSNAGPWCGTWCGSPRISGWGPIAWVYCSEMYPTRFRAKANGLTTMANWLGNFFIGLLSPVLIDAIGYGAFFVYGGFCLACLYMATWLTETRGKTLEEITAVLEGRFGPRVHRQTTSEIVREIELDAMGSRSVLGPPAGSADGVELAGGQAGREAQAQAQPREAPECEASPAEGDKVGVQLGGGKVGGGKVGEDKVGENKVGQARSARNGRSDTPAAVILTTGGGAAGSRPVEAAAV
uniref:Major facilitator superfamily (MFS) profile domain-containing protein n=1 Tax=Haptolina ericina TaxID=156174 RepID=A0A7S3ETE0_9EUKA